MGWKLVRLNFGNNLTHFGETGIGLEAASERVRSDTLFSAWISAYARLFGSQAVGDLLTAIKENPTAWRFSSTFIYRQIRNLYTYYLPKPFVFPQGYPIEDDLDFTKEYKKLNFLPIDIWHRWYQTNTGFTEDDSYELREWAKRKKAEEREFEDNELYQSKTFTYDRTFATTIVPKVAIDRITRATNFYHTSFVKFISDQKKGEYTGLYFLVYFADSFAEVYKKPLEIALQVLEEEGLGGERSSGAGMFTAEWKDLDPDWQKILNPDLENPHYCLISMYWQEKLPPELLAPSALYEVKERGGWITSSNRQLRRKSIRMFAEGSVFPIQPQGKLADVTDPRFTNHSIYRSGISVSLPIINQEVL